MGVVLLFLLMRYCWRGSQGNREHVQQDGAPNPSPHVSRSQDGAPNPSPHMSRSQDGAPNPSPHVTRSQDGGQKTGNHRTVTEKTGKHEYLTLTRNHRTVTLTPNPNGNDVVVTPTYNPTRNRSGSGNQKIEYSITNNRLDCEYVTLKASRTKGWFKANKICMWIR